MNTETIQRLKLGIFITLGTIFFIMAIYYIGNKQNLFGDTFVISSTFKNVNGLQTGNNVRYSGINVGTVNEIIIINDTTVKVNMVIGEEVRKHIKKDAVATISSDGLVGNMLVNIIPGSGGGASVKDDDIIQSYSRQGAEDMLNTLNTTNENIALLTTDLLEITRSIVRGEGVLGALLYDTAVTTNLKSTVANLKASSNQSLELMESLNRTVANLNNGDGLAGLLMEDTVITTQIGRIVADLEATGQQISKVSQDVDSIVTTINSARGVAGSLVYDSLMANDLKETMSNINEGSALFNENMLALRKNFFFRRYFKKKEKQKN